MFLGRSVRRDCEVSILTICTKVRGGKTLIRGSIRGSIRLFFVFLHSEVHSIRAPLRGPSGGPFGGASGGPSSFLFPSFLPSAPRRFTRSSIKGYPERRSTRGSIQPLSFSFLPPSRPAAVHSKVHQTSEGPSGGPINQGTALERPYQSLERTRA